MQKLFITLITLSAILNACNDVENPPAPNEEELITTVKVSFTEVGNTSNTATYTFSDPDGEGGKAPLQFDTIKLKPELTYSVSIFFYDESNASYIKNLTSEIEEEKNDHFICLNTTLNGANFTYKDLDDNSLPIGLQSEFKTTTSGNGELSVSLKHQPGTKNGTCDVGETDVEVVFLTEVF